MPRWVAQVDAAAAQKEVGQGLITTRTQDGVRCYAVLRGARSIIRIRYTSGFDAGEWVPYPVREIRGVPEAAETEAVTTFASRTTSWNEASKLEVGAPSGPDRTVHGDDRVHDRCGKGNIDDAECVMLRMAENGSSHVSPYCALTASSRLCGASSGRAGPLRADLADADYTTSDRPPSTGNVTP